jgi:hypothetical protein
MLKKSFVFMMLLAASLIGIGSAIHHQPETSIGQPQQSPAQPLQPQQPQQQAQSPSTAPHTLGKRLTQADQALLDRLFPHIIGKLDGETLAQKIDAETLINKIGGKRLAEIVLPHIQVSVGAAPAYTQKTTVNKDALAPDTYHTVSVATCPPGTRVFGGGGHVLDRSLNNPRNNAEDNQIVESGVSDRGGWKITAKMSSSGDVYGYALCGKATLSIR